MRRFALLLLAGAPALVAAPVHPLAGQGFGVYEHNTCAMGRAGVTAARPCADGSAIYFSPAGLAGLTGTHISAGVTLIGAQGSFTDDFLATRSDLKNPLIPVPNVYITHAVSPKVTAGIGLFAPYGLETKWDANNFSGRFLGYNTNIRSIYIQPTLGYQVGPKLKLGIGVAYITSHLKLRQRADLSTQLVPPALAALFPAPLPPGTTFAMLGVPTGTDFADATLEANGSGFAVNFGAIWKVNDRLSIGGHWLTRKQIQYDGTAAFVAESTHLFLPQAIGPLPAGYPVDALLAPEFTSGGPLSDGAVATSITMPPQGSIGFAYKANDEWSFMADYQYVVWGWFNDIDINFANAGTPDLALHPLRHRVPVQRKSPAARRISVSHRGIAGAVRDAAAPRGRAQRVHDRRRDCADAALARRPGVSVHQTERPARHGEPRRRQHRSLPILGPSVRGRRGHHFLRNGDS